MVLLAPHAQCRFRFDSMADDIIRGLPSAGILPPYFDVMPLFGAFSPPAGFFLAVLSDHRSSSSRGARLARLLIQGPLHSS